MTLKRVRGGYVEPSCVAREGGEKKTGYEPLEREREGGRLGERVTEKRNP